jgi:hypothetical protein
MGFTAGSVSVFVPLDHAVLAHSVADNRRTASFTTYSLVGALAGALGGFAAGSPDLMARMGVSQLPALKVMFVLYAVLGVGAALLDRGLPALTQSDTSKGGPLGPSRPIVLKLVALFSIDSFAGGLVLNSLLERSRSWSPAALLPLWRCVVPTKRY